MRSSTTSRSSQPGMQGARRLGSRRKAQTASGEALTVKRSSKWGTGAPSPCPLPIRGRGMDLQRCENALGGKRELGHRSAHSAGDGIHHGGGGGRHGRLADALRAERPEALARLEEQGDDGRRVERGGDLVVEEMRVLRYALFEDHLLEDSVTEPLDGAAFDLSLGALPIDGLSDVVAGGKPGHARLTRLLVHLDLHRLRAEGVIVERLAL